MTKLPLLFYGACVLVTGEFVAGGSIPLPGSNGGKKTNSGSIPLPGSNGGQKINSGSIPLPGSNGGQKINSGSPFNFIGFPVSEGFANGLPFDYVKDAPFVGQLGKGGIPDLKQFPGVSKGQLPGFGKNFDIQSLTNQFPGFGKNLGYEGLTNQLPGFGKNFGYEGLTNQLPGFGKNFGYEGLTNQLPGFGKNFGYEGLTKQFPDFGKNLDYQSFFNDLPGQAGGSFPDFRNFEKFGQLSKGLPLKNGNFANGILPDIQKVTKGVNVDKVAPGAKKGVPCIPDVHKSTKNVAPVGKVKVPSVSKITNPSD